MESSNAILTTSNEIIKFMNLTFKEWTTNDGIGKEANKFIFFNTMKFHKQISNDSLPNEIVLENMYSLLTQEYIIKRDDYKNNFVKKCIETYFEREFSSNETIKDLTDGFDQYYNSLKCKQEYEPEIFEVE